MSILYPFGARWASGRRPRTNGWVPAIGAGQALSQHTLGFSTHTGGLAKRIRFGVETSA